MDDWPPPLAFGTVASVDGEHYKCNIILDGPAIGQMPALPCDVATRGPRDAVRGEFPELPTPGTRVLVAFPRCDIRNGVVLGSVGGTLVDANAFQAGVAGARSRAAWSGQWSYDAEGGQHATVYPDGTQVLAGYTAPPALTRHVLAAGPSPPAGTRQAAPYGQQQRVPSPPAPFPVAVNHPTGAWVRISPAGAVSANAAAGQALTLTTNGAAIEIDAAGNVLVSSPALARVTAPVIQLGDGGTLQELATAAFAVWAGNHVHVNAGGSGDSGPPATPPPGNSLTAVVTAQ